MATIAGTLTQSQVQQAQLQAQTIASSATTTISSNQFVFFAAFDGTNNDKNNIPQGEQSTNVGQLAIQAESAMATNPNLVAKYYAGPGTSGSLAGSSAIPSQVTQEAINTANRAYDDFQAQASAWVEQNPGGSVTAAMATFSRGADAGAVFSQLLYERGLTDPLTGATLISPGQVGVSAGVIYDPVETGMSGNMAFAPNVQNLAIIRADNEYRYAFEAADYFNQPGATTYNFAGNHCDVGGSYARGDDGLAALALQAGTGFLQNSGLSIAGVPESRQFDPTKDVNVHTEAFDSFNNEMWSTYGTYGLYAGPRLTDQVATPAQVTTDGNTTTTRFTDFSGKDIVYAKVNGDDGSVQNTMTVRDYFNGTTTTSIETIKTDTSGTRTTDFWTYLNGNFTDHVTATIDLDGDFQRSSFNSDGTKLSTDWQKTDGSSGTNLFYAAGQKTADTWQNADGTYGSTSYNPVDGSISGIAYNADNSYSTFLYDGQGSTDASFFDGQGNTIGGQCLIDYEPTPTVPLPSTTSVSDTLNAAWSTFDDELEAACYADGFRSFVGLDSLNPWGTSAETNLDSTGVGVLFYFTGVSESDVSQYYDQQPSYANAPAPGQSNWTYDNTQYDFVSPTVSVSGYTGYSSSTQYASSYYLGLNLSGFGGSSGDFSFGASYGFSWGPVVLDLDNDGIELVAPDASNAWFDVNGTGERHQTGWVGANDGLLAIDENLDGRIAGAREVAFGQWTTADDTDVEALASVFDSNHDGKLSAADARFGEFRLWQDANGNGESDAGEVRTLAEAGIVSVGVQTVKVDYEAGGNQLKGFATYKKADGSRGWASAVNDEAFIQEMLA